MTTQAHTPTPWRQNGHAIVTNNGMSLLIATCAPAGVIHGYASKTLEESRANATLVVQAVNAYDANQALIAEQVAEIARYKSALEHIATHDYHADEIGYIGTISAMRKEATEALQAQEVAK